MRMRKDIFDIYTKIRYTNSKYFDCPRIGDVILTGVTEGVVLRETQRAGKWKLEGIMQ